MEEKKQKTFADGMIFKNPRENAPEFVKGAISIKVEEFKAFLDKHNNNGWVNLDLLKSQKGPLYFALNDWKPTTPASNPAEAMRQGIQQVGGDQALGMTGGSPLTDGEIKVENVPF
jgi:hypothetical protein|tara:strand:- start:2618 stop:2965 length:348 start_codon:yes stop_codon:yes gene_type:complete